MAISYWFQWVSQQSPDTRTLELAAMTVQRALAETERGVVLAPTEALSYAALAEVLSCIGRPGEALEAAAQALRLKNETGDEHLYNVGTACAMAGRYEEARAEAAAVLRINPHWSLEVWKQRTPYKDRAVLDRHIAALRRAGLK